MAGDDHKRGASRGQFCGTAGTPCECPKANNYRTVCTPYWDGQKYPQIGAFKKTIQRGYEAHHLLCVSQVEKVIVQEGQKNDFTGIVEETEWCINDKSNMVALPMWGHTIMWYCNQFAGITPAGMKNVLSLITGNTAAPDWQNLPQHNYGHSGRDVASSYNKEVEMRLQRVVNAIEKSKKEHKDKVGTLQTALTKLSGWFESELKNRGIRGGGTHTNWVNGAANPMWYLPFAMCAQPYPMPYPGNLNSAMAQRIVRIASLLC